ncbi:hypothetical protein FGIG_01902 [Fasciola gigantica]|uniref:Uncharacterized protein n=1 Tax=Fasciola gigantica TaxID=46835 RepID=A0A504YKG6_FASGI|nr:hypothetical protein FGIG_01902 [Fasciola gigantica]
MDGNTNQTKSRTALFRPAVPTLKAFSPGDDFALGAVRVKTHLQDTPPEHLGQYLLQLLDDDAARQFLATGAHPFGPRYNLAGARRIVRVI